MISHLSRDDNSSLMRWLVIFLEMTSKTGKMSFHLCICVNIFKTQTPDTLNDTWHIYSMDRVEHNFSEAEFWISVRAPCGATPNIAQSLKQVNT